MNWYVVKLCFEIQSGSCLGQVEEQIRMIQAFSEAEAIDKAYSLGQKINTSIPRIDGVVLNWKFLGIRSVYCLPELNNEHEIYSDVVVPDDIERYRHDLKLFHETVVLKRKKAHISA